MPESKHYITDKRMMKLLESLQQSGKIRFVQEFCDIIGLEKQNMRAVKIGERHFSHEHIRKAAVEYKINVNWIYGIEKEMYRQ